MLKVFIILPKSSHGFEYKCFICKTWTNLSHSGMILVSATAVQEECRDSYGRVCRYRTSNLLCCIQRALGRGPHIVLLQQLQHHNNTLQIMFKKKRRIKTIISEKEICEQTLSTCMDGSASSNVIKEENIKKIESDEDLPFLSDVEAMVYKL